MVIGSFACRKRISSVPVIITWLPHYESFRGRIHSVRHLAHIRNTFVCMTKTMKNMCYIERERDRERRRDVTIVFVDDYEQPTIRPDE